MKKYCNDLLIVKADQLSEKHVLLRLSQVDPLPEMLPGQFVEVLVPQSANTFLRRPISINYVDRANNELWLLIAAVGDGTKSLYQMQVGQTLNIIFPLGNAFTQAQQLKNKNVLLIGGGVGTAPMLFQGSAIAAQGGRPHFLLGGRRGSDLLQLDLFKRYGEVHITTEDGSLGEKGFVTNHTILQQEHFDMIQTCGPKPMMMAVASYAKQNGIACEVSLENLMACGLGACLCCVEKTVEGNLCVCKDGPVFNIDRLLW